MNIADNRTAAGFYIGGTWSVDGNTPELLKIQVMGVVLKDGTRIPYLTNYS